LELYVNYGFLGAVAGLYASIKVAQLGYHLLSSPRSHPWYGFALGTVWAVVAVTFIAVFESAPLGIPAAVSDVAYYPTSPYTASPLPWFLGASLVILHRLLQQ